MKVLMATDGSRDSTVAMTSASRLLRKKDLNVDILCVAPQLARPEKAGKTAAGGSLWDDYTERIEAPVGQILRTAQKSLSAEGVDAATVFKVGSPAECILQSAAAYDLVVVGAHGRHERRQPGLGPVSSRVVQNSRGSVLVGRELGSEGNYRVLVALDGSEASFEALRRLNVYFDASSLDVTLMHVVELPWAQLGTKEDDDFSVGMADYSRALTRELRREAESIVDEGLRQLDAWGASATTVIEEGDPTLELSSYAESGNYDLIAVGATGSSDVKHALLGSVSLKLAWNAPASVLVVRV